jgi:hypothetical protein
LSGAASWSERAILNRLLASGGAPLLRLQLQADTPRSHGTGRYQREYQRFNPQLFSDGFEPGDPN